jgi:MtfA peptidase
MLLKWFQYRRRRRLLHQPWKRDELAALEQVKLYHLLSPTLQRKLRHITRILIDEKHWEGCAGFTVTSEVQIVIASQAALLLLYMQHDYFSRVPTILVYPKAFTTTRADDHTDEEFIPDKAAEGQAVYRGPVILAWDEVLHDALYPEEGENVVIHEFAHQLDFLDNNVDGVPLLESMNARTRWKNIMNAALEQHRDRIDDRQRLFFPRAAAESVTEFFAYASEIYYTHPQELRQHYPEVFEQLRSFYKLDTSKTPWSI